MGSLEVAISPIRFSATKPEQNKQYGGYPYIRFFIVAKNQVLYSHEVVEMDYDTTTVSNIARRIPSTRAQSVYYLTLPVGHHVYLLITIMVTCVLAAVEVM